MKDDLIFILDVASTNIIYIPRDRVVLPSLKFISFPTSNELTPHTTTINVTQLACLEKAVESFLL